MIGYSGKKNKNSGHTEVCFTVRTEKVEHPSAIIKIFSSEIEGNPVIAEVPTETKSECEKLLQKETLTEDESEFLYNNYWVNIQFKGERHGYCAKTFPAIRPKEPDNWRVKPISKCRN